MTDASIERATIYKGEVQLLSWTENDKGRKAVLQLDPHVGEQHPFRSIRPGRRLMLVAVLIGDDEQPETAQAQASPRQGPTNPNPPTAETSKRPEYTRSQIAFNKVNDPTFCAWLMGRYQTRGSMKYDTPDAFVKALLGIASKSELDSDPSKAAAWDALLTEFDTRFYTR